MRSAIVLVVVLVGASSASAQAGEALIQHHAQLERELSRPASPLRERRLIRLLDRAIDYDMIVRRVLVVHWGDLSAAQRDDVTQLLTRAIRHRYRQNIEALAGWQVAVVSEGERGVGRQVVTRARRGPEAREIAYDLYAAQGQQWRVVDLVIEGDSLVHQYRTRFDHVIRREGWAGFMARLRATVEREGS